MKQMKAMGASWARSFIAACLAMYMAGVTDPKAIGAAGLSAIVPLIMRYLNPKDAAFGLSGK